MIESPRITLFLFCYQQAEFVTAAVQAALAQDYDNLQIVISDDASTDETYTIAQSLVSAYQGPHQIILNQNQKNLGIGYHFIHIMENLAEGELIVASAGDDISAPNRVSRIVEQWLAHNKPALIAHSLEEINEQGHTFTGSRTIQYRMQIQPGNWPQTMALHEYLRHPFPLPYIGAALAYRRDLYKKFPTPITAPDYEDHLMYFRALLAGQLHYFPEALIKYRRHKNNFTAKLTNPSEKIIKVPELYASLLQNPSRFQPYEAGVFRLHRLQTQQWLDYITTLQTGKVSIDSEAVSLLWEQLLTRHSLLLRYKNRLTAIRIGLCYSVSQFISTLQQKWGSPHYQHHDSLLGMSYLPPLRTIVFGAGEGGRKALANLSGAFKVIAVSDNNTTLHGKRFCGLSVISPMQLSANIEEVDCIMIASIYYHEIKATLIDEYGIPKNKIGRAPYACITQTYSKNVTATAITLTMIVSSTLLLTLLGGLLL